jgi:ATP-dependent DNA helicase RecG
LVSMTSENLIYPYVSIKDLRLDLVSKARKLAVNQRPGHLWAGMSDIELLKNAQLFQRDYQSGKKGFTLAAILLLGDDQVITQRSLLLNPTGCLLKTATSHMGTV